MAHQLSFQKNAKGDFVSKNVKPWHGFGTILDTLSYQDAMIYGGLDYVVEKSPNVHRIGKTEIVSETSFFTFRPDTEKVLGIVGNRYTPVQNDEVFSFAEQFPYHIETAGVLKNGAISFVCMKSDREIIVKGEDKTEFYLLMVNSFDGTTPISILFTPIRVVCNNTLTAAIKGTTDKYTFRHTQSATEKVREFAKVMGLLDKNVTALNELFNIVAEKQVNPLDFMSYVFLTEKEVADIAAGRLTDGMGDSIISTRKKNIILDTLKYYESGAGQPEWKGTAWGAYNGVTGYMGTKDFENGEDQMLSTVFNTNYKNVSDKALQIALNGVPKHLPTMETLLFN